MVNPVIPKEEAVAPPISEPLKIKISKRKIYIAAAIAGICILTITAYFLLPESITKQLGISKEDASNTTKTTEDTQQISSDPGKKPDTAIARVGEEYIFQSDLDIELATYPGTNKNEKIKKILLEKLVKDSIILQAAKKDKLLSPTSLDKTVYNTADKNYMKRIHEVKKVEEKVNSNLEKITGTIVSVWFHNMFPAKIGLEAGKKEALKRITDLRKRVVNKEITIEDAGRLITSDPSYEELDMGYQNNGLVTFSATWGERITIDDKFDTAILKLQPGQVSEVVLGRNVNGFTNKLEEAYYAFAQVKTRTGIGNSKDFDAWYDAQKKNYEITYY